ncbi:uncharacterized protein LOC103313645 [Tribolium castaneum]|uniref:uncharacterized protein LOC103313645 n=1 Tax=Tribolium castaneum TaxID=7070 RepID=UPI0001DCAF30|nr:PREDICTED: uncharacterized protein LOC103313645 [Tribolium castaneum]|eukprot:XP_008195690.1 PREDICTED: uncharacterized protein LOC103313645 [Tribolium castaneum]
MNSSNRTTKEDLDKWLEIFLQKEGLHNYSFEISGNSAKGDNYLSDITFVEISGQTQTNENKKYHLVIKCGKKSDELRKIIPIQAAFENEIYFYTKVYPVFLEFQKEKNIEEPFNNVAKCYDAFIKDGMEVIILENMKSNGFFLHNRNNSMNKDHVLKVIKLYGKLHAISFALKDQKPEIFQALAEKFTDVMKIASETMKLDDETNFFQEIIDAAKEKNEHEIVEKAHILNKKSRTHNDITDPSDPYAIILHGDCWNNNFMFKYKDDEKMQLSEVCFLDFQLSRLASPVYDLSYFLFCCLSEKEAENFDEIIDVYYESFCSFVKKLGSDPDKVFPYEELLNQWKKFSLFGLVMMPNILRACVQDKDEVKDLAELVETGQGFTEAYKESFKNTKKFGERTLPIMRLAIRKGFI